MLKLSLLISRTQDQKILKYRKRRTSERFSLLLYFFAVPKFWWKQSSRNSNTDTFSCKDIDSVFKYILQIQELAMSYRIVLA